MQQDTIDTLKLNNKIEFISSKTLSGIPNLLIEIEKKILQLTNRKKMIIKAEMGSTEIAWLYKNCAVTDAIADPINNQNLMLHVVISDITLEQFKHYFVGKRTKQ